MYICVCNGVTDKEIRQCAEMGASSVEELQQCLGVGANCGKCRKSAQTILDTARPYPPTFLPQMA